MADDARVGLGGPGQRTTERVGGWDEILIAIRNTIALMIMAGVTAPLVALATLIVGPWALVVLIPAGIEAVARWFEPDIIMERASKAAWGVTVLVFLALVPERALAWWPWSWQVNRSTSWGLLWPAEFPGLMRAIIALRIVPVIAVARAIPQTWYLAQRLRREIMAPTASGAAYESASLANIDIPNAYNPHRLPGEAPQVTVNPVRPVPFNAPKAALTLDVLMTPTGKRIGADDVLDMLDAQPAAGLSWRTWHSRNWTRSDWEAALEILEAQGLVTPRQSGRTTALTVSVDDAMDAIERLT